MGKNGLKCANKICSNRVEQSFKVQDIFCENISHFKGSLSTLYSIKKVCLLQKAKKK